MHYSYEDCEKLLDDLITSFEYMKRVVVDYINITEITSKLYKLTFAELDVSSDMCVKIK